MTKDTRRLGRGLSSVIAADLQQRTGTDGSNLGALSTLPTNPTAGPAHRLLLLDVEKIRQNPMQPRRRFNDESLSALAKSLASRGALQPIVVRPAEGGYELVSGERRLRAAKLAGLKELPAIVRGVRDDDLLELALIENVHRDDLNPIERGRAYRTLNERYNLSHEQIAERMGDDRATVTNYIRLLGLPDAILDMVSSKSISSGHAKVILGVASPDAQMAFADRVVKQKWSVRQLEAAVAASRKPGGAEPKRRAVRPAVQDMEEKLGRTMGARVTIREGRRRHTGKLVIEYSGLDEFERIVSLLGVTNETA